MASVALAAIAIPLWQKRDYVITLNALANDARAQAGVSEALRTELENKVGDYNFALERKYSYPSAFRVVDEISRVLPDDTWLTQFEMKTLAKGKETQREILVRGETANAGRLVQLVEESPLFAQTAPRSPTTKIQPGPGEIFDLGAQLKPLPAPVQVALLPVEKVEKVAGRRRLRPHPRCPRIAGRGRARDGRRTLPAPGAPEPRPRPRGSRPTEPPPATRAASVDPAAFNPAAVAPQSDRRARLLAMQEPRFRRVARPIRGYPGRGRRSARKTRRRREPSHDAGFASRLSQPAAARAAVGCC